MNDRSPRSCALGPNDIVDEVNALNTSPRRAAWAPTGDKEATAAARPALDPSTKSATLTLPSVSGSNTIPRGRSMVTSTMSDSPLARVLFRKNVRFTRLLTKPTSQVTRSPMSLSLTAS